MSYGGITIAAVGMGEFEDFDDDIKIQVESVLPVVRARTFQSPTRQHIVSRSPRLSTAAECDEDLSESTAEELQPLNAATGSLSNGDSSSSLTTTTTGTTSQSTSSGMMSNGERIPRLSVGPYFQRPAPILTDAPIMNDFLNIPPPSSPPPPSTELRGPPPQWNPPVPPSSAAESMFDESQYEEPEAHSDSEQSRGNFTRRQTPSRLPLAHGNNYEISTSQQLRSAVASKARSARHEGGPGIDSPWDDETRQMLVQNPETGSFYVPTGSGHTTMSSLSPHSGRYEKSCGPGPVVGASVASTSNIRGSRFGSSIVKDASRTGEYEMKKVPLEGFRKVDMTKKRLPSYCNWRTIAICLLLLLAFSCFVILILLLSRDGQKNVYVHSTRSIYSSSNTPSLGQHQNCSLQTTAEVYSRRLPEQFQLGEQIEGELPPAVIVYTRFSLQRDSEITFNLTVEPRAQIVLYGRLTALPSPSVHDFMYIIQADRLYPLQNTTERRKRSYSHPGLPQLRSAILTHFLLAGRWHLGFLNDGQQPQLIRMSVGVAADRIGSRDERIEDCRFDCTGHGECKDGKCHCFHGYTGTYCEESFCPVLCSGNGVFSGGRCVCHEGYKGVDCDMLSSWCEVPNCNGHGSCQNGLCECDSGWTGEYCQLKDCEDSACSGHGVCHGGKCYCEYGYHGEKCEEVLNWQSICESLVEKPEPRAEKVVADGGGAESMEPSPDVDPTCNSRGRVDTDTGICRCIPGYHGDKCQLAQCQLECLHGFCGNGVCECEKGWIGIDCGEKQCLAGCEEHGLCKNGTCICQKGWNGENCHISGCGNNCNGHGECKLFNDTWKCACDRSRFGSDCTLPIETDCDDGVDNDQDGLVDCEDSECCTARSCASSQMCTTVIQPRDVLLKALPSINSNFYQQVRFLIQPDSVQRYADYRQFNESLVSVIRGRVISTSGSPLTGVRVAEAQHPPLTGFTLSRSEDDGGAFDLMVNGGRVVTLQFMRRPFEKLERSFYVPWNEIVYIGDIRMYMGAAPTVAAENEEIDEHCRDFHASHRIAPSLFPSWLTNQYAGRVSSSEHSSQILVDSRTAFDSVQVPGTTDIFLVYDSSRAEKYRSSLVIELLPDSVPEMLRLVHLEVNIVGNHFEKIFSAKPNLTFTYSWDQTNVYVQTVSGLVKAQVVVGYEYAGCGEGNIIWVHRSVKLEGRKAKRFNLGTWTINVHHHYDVVNNVLEKGDGSRIYLDESSQILKTIVGSEQQRPISCPFCNEPASTARLFRPEALCAGGDGSLYIGDYNLIRRLTPDGRVVTILELSMSDTAHPYYMAVDPRTDLLHISLPLRRQVWQINKEVNGRDITGNYNVVVGDGSTCSDTLLKCGDDGPADLAQLTFPKGIAFDSNGNTFISDSRRIRMVNKERKISTLISDRAFGPRPCFGDIDDLAKVKLEWPTSLAVDPQSNDLLILDSNVIYRVLLRSRTAHLVIGSLAECEKLSSLNGEPLSLRQLNDAKSIAVAADSTLYIAESNGKRLNQIRALSPDGRARVVVGRLSKCDCGMHCPCDNDKPTVGPLAFLHNPSAITVDPAGALYVADQGNYKIKKLVRSRASYDESTKQYRVNSPHTNEVYLFNRNGLHLSTWSLLSGTSIYNFTYNVDTSSGRLTQITGAGGHYLRLRRINETETVLEASAGQRTVLDFDNFEGNLETVTLPTTGLVKFSYVPGQLLRSKERASRLWFYEYNDMGQATALINPSGMRLSVKDHRLEQGKLFTEVLMNGKPHSIYSFADNEFSEFGAENRRVMVLDDGLLIDALGYRTHFDGVTHPLLEGHETAILKRKITVAATTDPPRRELNMRFEWRGYIHRKDRSRRSVSKYGRRVLQVNGRNVFTIEFDREKKTDTIKNSGDEEVLRIVYNDAGQIISIVPRESSRLAQLTVFYDSHGRQKKLSWGNATIDFTYDRQSRISQSSMGNAADFLTRKFLYQKESHLFPTSVQLPSGDKFRWRYDQFGAVSSLKTPSNEVHHFSRSATIDRILLHRHPPFVNASFLSSVDDGGNLLEYATPDGAHYLSLKRDLYGRVVQITADADNVFTHYPDRSTGGTKPVKIVSPSLERRFMYQGALPVAMQERHIAIVNGHRRFPETSAYFSYEYDDHFRLTSLTAEVNGLHLDPIRFEYDSRDGRLTGVQDFKLLRDGPRSRISGHKIMIESLENEQAEEITRKVMVGMHVLEMKVQRDTLGRTESVEWTVLGDRRPLDKHSYNINGQLAQLTMGENEDRRWTLHYDLEGRLKALNDVKLLLHTGGTPRRFGKNEYIVDKNGWVLKRGNVAFDLDVYGRVRSVKQSEVIDVDYGYDEMSRVIWRRVGEETLQRFFYAFPHQPRLISHFISTANEAVSTVIYNERGVPIALRQGESHYAIVTDVDRSVRFIFGPDATLVKEIVRNPLGRTILDTNPSFYFPLGYLSEFDDPLTGITVVGPDARPLDSLTGRFLSTPVSYAQMTIDVFNPEIEADPFRLLNGLTVTPRKIPIEAGEWMEFAGFSLAQIVPSLHSTFSSSRTAVVSFDIPSNLCDLTISHSLSAAFCSLLTKTKHFSQFLTMTTTGILPSPHIHSQAIAKRVPYSATDSVGFKGVVFAWKGSATRASLAAEEKYFAVTESLNSLLNSSYLVDTADIGLASGSKTIAETHFASSSASPPETANELNSVFNVSMRDTELILSSGRTSINFHFGTDPDHVRLELIRQRTKEMESRIWKREGVTASIGIRTRRQWTESELQDLFMNGFIPDYNVLFHPANSLPILSNQNLWVFDRSKN